MHTVGESIGAASKNLALLMQTLKSSECLHYSSMRKQIKLGMEHERESLTDLQANAASSHVQCALWRTWILTKAEDSPAATSYEKSGYLEAMSFMIKNLKHNLVELVMYESHLRSMIKWNQKHKPLGMFLPTLHTFLM